MKILNPLIFKRFSSKVIPWLFCTTFIFFILGLFYSYKSPDDYMQGDLVKIMYIHVPSAWMSMFAYCFAGIFSLSAILYEAPVSFFISIASSYFGFIFASLTLITGSIWGYFTWGTWWVWDARLTSMFILWLFYIAHIVIIKSSDNIWKTYKVACVICLIGMVNIPIVKFSVNMWNSLHQPPSVLRPDGPSIHYSMLLPLFLMFFAYVSYFFTLILMKTNVFLKKS